MTLWQEYINSFALAKKNEVKIHKIKADERQIHFASCRSWKLLLEGKRAKTTEVRKICLTLCESKHLFIALLRNTKPSQYRTDRY